MVQTYLPFLIICEDLCFGNVGSIPYQSQTQLVRCRCILCCEKKKQQQLIFQTAVIRALLDGYF